jgi:hypothetical protein
LRACYGCAPRDSEEFALTALYQPRSPSKSAPAPVHVPLAAHPVYERLDLHETVVVHHDGAATDWLAEVFEWLSHADDYAVSARDDVGRVPFAASYHGRNALDTTIPYASIAMLELARELHVELQPEPLVVAASHDLDYLPTDARDNIVRLLKNLAIALLAERDVALAAGIATATLVGAMRGRSPLDCIDMMLAEEAKRGMTSSVYVICRNASRRDANYSLSDPSVLQTLNKLQRAGCELGLHASYECLRDRALPDEAAALRSAGYEGAGVRAHWLRYAGADLFDAIEAVEGIRYDATVGFSERVGFRSGASFVYRPYDFAAERAYDFYEIPLAIMDGALWAHARHCRTSARELCNRVLDVAQAFPGGALGILWHNTVFEGAQLPREIGSLYWDLPRAGQRWMRGIDLVNERREAFEHELDGVFAC